MGIRPARLPDDEVAILSFLHGLQDHEAAFEPDRRRDPAWADEHWQEALRRRDAHHGIMLIAEEDGAAVGWAFAHDETNELFVVEADRDHGFIAELFVVPEARGKGLGRALIAACEDWARGRGHNLLLIGVLAKNARALRAYEGAGYSPYNMILRKYL
jgi:GNAT superfamily N-acetyltransferase